MRSPVCGRGAILGDFGVGMGSALGGQPLPAKRSRAARKAVATVITPVNQSIVTVGTDVPIVASDNAPVSVSGAPLNGGSPRTVWRPTTTNFNVDLQAGGGATSKVAVAEANRINTNFTAWTLSNLSAAGGFPDPDGGTAAYKVTCSNSSGASVQHNLSKSASPVSVVGNGGYEIWAGYDGSLPALLVNPLDDGAVHYCYFDLFTGQTGGNFSYGKIVETRVVQGITWRKIWFGSTNGALVGSMFMTLCQAINANSFISAGTEYMYLYLPRPADGVLPFTNYQKSKNNSLGVVSGLDRWVFHNGFIDSNSDDANDRYIDVLKPTTYTTAKKYPVVYVGMVEPTVNVYADPLATIKALGLHDTYDCIFATSQTKNMPWYGTRNDGTMQCEVQYRDVLVGLVDEFYSTIRSREGRMFLGFSKSGWGGLSLLLRAPTVFGYAAAWDVPWYLVYGDFETVLAFNSAAQLALYDPKQIIQANRAVLCDKPRLVVAGSAQFATDVQNFHAFLQDNFIPHSYLFNLLGGGGADHNWNTGWLPSVVAALMQLRAYTP